MELLILFAFLAGLATVLSPCVLPVLPLLLSTSVGGGRWRPLSIVLGLAATFTVATLGVAATVQAFAVPAVWLRIIAIVALGLFGLSMLVPAVARAFERAFSPLARLVNTGSMGKSFLGGFALGACLGLVWAPCVGPIMATVIALTTTTGLTTTGVAITLAYTLGAGVPMLLIGFGARGFAKSLRQGSRSVVLQRVFGGITLVICAALLFGLDTRFETFALANLPAEVSNPTFGLEQQAPVQKQLDTLDNKPSLQAAAPPTSAPVQAPIQPTAVPAMPTQPAPQPTSPQPTSTDKPQPAATTVPGIVLQDMGVAPDFTGIAQWFNSKPLTLAQLRGKVVIVDFWTFACYNCQNTMPHVRALYDKYHSQGLEIVGVHTPELSFERVPANIQSAAKEQGVIWPIAFDPNYSTWNAYQNRYWPAFYFIDANGHIRYEHFGEGNYDYHDKVVAQLLSEAKSAGK